MKNETQHTRGRWTVVEYTASDAIVVHAGHEPDGEICLISRQDPQSDGGRSRALEMANARLIAAAPELLAALKEQARFADQLADKDDLSTATGRMFAAIAKAEGRT